MSTLTRRAPKKGGPDVSEHNGSVDWKKVAAAGWDLAFVRAAYIGPGDNSVNQKVDGMFNAKRVAEIRAAGLVWSPYMYCIPRHGMRGRDDARFLFNVARKAGYVPGIDGKLTADVEESDLDGKGNSDYIDDFEYEAHLLACNSIDYSNIAGLSWARKANTSCWVAQPGEAAGHPTGIPGFAHEWVVHQFTFTGSVNGISGPVDLNWIKNGRGADLLSPPFKPVSPPVLGLPAKNRISHGPWITSYTKGLVYLGYLPTGVTDTFDQDVEEATALFQTHHARFGLHATGVVDNATLAIYRSAVTWRKSHPTASPAPAPPHPTPAAVVKSNSPSRGFTTRDVQQAMWTFLHNRGYAVKSDRKGKGGLPVNGVWDDRHRKAALECHWRLGYPDGALGQAADDRFMRGLVHPSYLLRNPKFPGYGSRGAKRAAQHKFFDLTTALSGKTAKWDGVTVSTFIYNANTTVERKTRVHATISDPVYGGVRTDAMQGRLRADYVNSGYDPAFIAAAVGQSRHQRTGPKEGAEDLSNPSDFDAACTTAGQHPPYRYNYDGSGDIVHVSDNAG